MSERNAPAHQIKQRFLGNRAHGGAVGATDIVGIDFQFRLGVDGGVLAHAEILVGQLGVCTRCSLMNVDAAVERTFAAVCHDVVDGLLTAASGAAMFKGYLLIKAP